jgi:phospholipid/cholesterol/gamma-HCH transport system ATP-binding protein
MHSARKVADRIVMLHPFSRLKPGESQVLFDDVPEMLDKTRDRRVKQFVHGEAGERLMEMLVTKSEGDLETPNLYDSIRRNETDGE